MDQSLELLSSVIDPSLSYNHHETKVQSQAQHKLSRDSFSLPHRSTAMASKYLNNAVHSPPLDTGKEPNEEPTMLKKTIGNLLPPTPPPDNHQVFSYTPRSLYNASTSTNEGQVPFFQSTKVEDGAQGRYAHIQQGLSSLEKKISELSTVNYSLTIQLQELDSRIALLIKNRRDISSNTPKLSFKTNRPSWALALMPPSTALRFSLRKSIDTDQTSEIQSNMSKLFSNFLFILQNDPRYLTRLIMLLPLDEHDQLLDIIMFNILGTHQDEREDLLLLTIIDSILSCQYDLSRDFTSLLRANSTLSRMLSCYLQRGQGQRYLWALLTPNFDFIFNLPQDLCFEIDPSKVYASLNPQGSGWDSMEQAREDKATNACLTRRLQDLSNIAELFLSRLVSSLDVVPYGIRWICKQIRWLCHRNFPNDHSEQAAVNAIGMFFILRYVAAAIVSPDSYGFTDKKLSPNQRQLLILVAKLLHKLIASDNENSKTSFDRLRPPFLCEENRKRMSSFLLSLSDVADFYEDLRMLQYAALAEQNLSISISVTQLLLLQTIFSEYSNELDTQYFNKGIEKSGTYRLMSILEQLGSICSEYRQQSRTLEDDVLELSLSSPSSDFMQYVDVPFIVAEIDALYFEGKRVLVELLRRTNILSDTASPADSYAVVTDTQDLDLVLKARQASLSSSKSMSAIGKEAIGLLEAVARLGMMDIYDIKNPLAAEIHKELGLMVPLKTRLFRDIDALEQVYERVKNNNSYLLNQIQSYQSYLESVRVQCVEKYPRFRLQYLSRLPHLPLSFFPSATVGSKGDFSPWDVDSSSLRSVRKLMRTNVISRCEIRDERIEGLFVIIRSPAPAIYSIQLIYRANGFNHRSLETYQISLDDLLERKQEGKITVAMEYITFDVNELIRFLCRNFGRH